MRTGLFPDSARPQASGYSEAGASRIRRALRSFIPRSTAPNEDIDQNNYTLRQRRRVRTVSAQGWELAAALLPAGSPD